MTKEPKIALIPWGEVIEDFLDPIGLDPEAFLRDMTEGWLFGYVKALMLAGYAPFIVVFSASTSVPRRTRHEPTGAPVHILPQPVRHRWLRLHLGDPKGRVWRGNSLTRSLTSLVQYASIPESLLRDTLAAEDCRALILQEYEYARSDRIAALVERMDLPVLATFQGADRTASPLENLFRYRTLSRLAALIVPSARERARLAERYGLPGAKVAALPNPLDLKIWHPANRAQARQKLGLDPARPIAICHGRIAIHAKGLDVLLEAWKGVTGARESDKPLLVLVGSGEDDESFGTLLVGYGQDTVLWRRGYITDRDEMRQWLSAADIYVSASRNEGMPVAPLEAMACGLPVIATDANGFDDIFAGAGADWGIQVPAGNASGLEAALKGMLRLPPAERARKGRAAQEHVRAHFSVEKAAAQFRDLLDGLCKTA